MERQFDVKDYLCTEDDEVKRLESLIALNIRDFDELTTLLRQ